MSAKARIVIADDNANIRLTLTDILTEHSYVVDAVKNGYELIAYLKKSEPDIIILDLMMPEKDGIEVFDCLKCLRPEIKIIIYTAFHRYSESQYARLASKFVLKDSPSQDLLKAIEELL